MKNDQTAQEATKSFVLQYEDVPAVKINVKVIK